MGLKLKLYPKRSAHWYIRGTVRGQAVFESTGTDDRQAAEAIRIKREGQILDRSVFGTGSTLTFAEAAASYLAKGGEAKYLGSYDEQSGKWTLLIGEFANSIVNAIGQVEADAAAQKLYPGTAASTQNRHCYVPLKAVLNHAAEKWKVSVQKIKKRKERKVPVEWAPVDYVNRLLPQLSPRYRRFVTMLIYTGERLEKVLAVDWDRHVDLYNRLITFPTTKNGEMRTVHVPDALLVELATVPEAERHGPMFPWRRKTVVHRPLKNACERAGIPYLSPHKLGRHTFATWLRRHAKRDLRGLMQDGGWKSINSVMRYAHVVAGETAEAVDKLPSVHNPCSVDIKPLKDRRIRAKRA